MVQKRLWTRDEFILTFNLYLKMPFGKMHRGNPQVVELAKLIGRSANSVALRLVNFASCDPALKARGIKGMSGGLKLCIPYWEEFANDQEKLVYESEKILARYQNIDIEEKFKNLITSIKARGEDKIREIKTRVNQNVFRQMILVNYDNKCAVSGVDIPELLIASHIIPWAEKESERLNPENGICLSALYDRAFDQGLISFDNDYKMIVSTRLKNHCSSDYYQQFFKPYIGKPLNEALDYMPRKEFLEWHRDVLFNK